MRKCILDGVILLLQFLLKDNFSEIKENFKLHKTKVICSFFIVQFNILALFQLKNKLFIVFFLKRNFALLKME